jgi:hypothetical protein
LFCVFFKELNRHYEANFRTGSKKYLSTASTELFLLRGRESRVTVMLEQEKNVWTSGNTENK